MLRNHILYDSSKTTEITLINGKCVKIIDTASYLFKILKLKEAKELYWTIASCYIRDSACR